MGKGKSVKSDHERLRLLDQDLKNHIDFLEHLRKKYSDLVKDLKYKISELKSENHKLIQIIKNLSQRARAHKLHDPGRED